MDPNRTAKKPPIGKKVLIPLILVLIAAAAALIILLPRGGGPAAPKEALPLDQAVLKAIPDSAQLTRYDADELYDIVGVPPQDHTEFVYLTGENDIGLVAREIIAVRAKDQAALDRAAAALNAYLERRKTETRSYAPDIYQLLEKASVKTKGLTAVLIISENGPDETGAFLAGE